MERQQDEVRFSVVIPAYNEADFLAETLQSLRDCAWPAGWSGTGNVGGRLLIGTAPAIAAAASSAR